MSKKTGRKCAYHEKVKPYLPAIQAWARDGLTDKQMMMKLAISHQAFYKYKNEFEEFRDALKKGKEVADSEVENALFEKCRGFTKTVKKPIKVKRVEYEYGKRVLEVEEVVMAEEEIYVPPDVTSMIFWLKNRRPDKWRDKQRVDIVVNELENLPPEEAMEHIRGMLKEMPEEIMKGILK